MGIATMQPAKNRQIAVCTNFIPTRTVRRSDWAFTRSPQCRRSGRSLSFRLVFRLSVFPIQTPPLSGLGGRNSLLYAPSPMTGFQLLRFRCKDGSAPEGPHTGSSLKEAAYAVGHRHPTARPGHIGHATRNNRWRPVRLGSRNCSEQRPHACGHRHRKCTPERDAYRAHCHACAARACSQPASRSSGIRA
jgi:hypothetical protein